MFDNGWGRFSICRSPREPVKVTIRRTEMVERVARASADELECALGQDAGFNDLTTAASVEVGGGAGGASRWPACRPGNSPRFFQHTHTRGSCALMNGYAFERYTDMVSGKRSVLRDLFELTVDKERLVRQFGDGLCWHTRRGCRCRCRYRSRIVLVVAGGGGNGVEVFSFRSGKGPAP